MLVNNSLNDIFSDLNSESSVILPKSIKIKNIIEDFNGISDALKPNATLTELNLEHNLFTNL